MSNTGFVDVLTAPVTAAPATFPGLGRFAPLTGPTIAPDGTVVLGTIDGKVIALRPDGRPFWDRELPHPQTILTSPVVGSDGSVYVIGSWVARDHRGGVTRRIGFAALHRFSLEGATYPATSFPEYGNGPTIIGAPSVWQYQGEEAIIVPATFPGVGAPEQRLLAFSPDGGLIAEWTQYLTGGDVEFDAAGSWGALIPHADFEPGYFVPPAYPPVPGVAISTNPQGGTPLIVFIDRYFQRTVTFSFCVGPSCSPAPGFQELIQRNHSPHTLWSSGTLAPDTNHTVVGTDDGVVFGGPSGSTLAPVTGLGEVYATPTVTVDGRIVAVTMFGEIIGLRGGAIVSRVQLSGQTIARPAASRNYVYVSTTEGLHTLDAEADATVAAFPLEGAGIWSPAIGPERHVYAIAANVLHIFPPLQRLPRQPRGQGIGRPGDGPVVG